MNDFEQCSDRLELDLILTFGTFSVTRKLIINGRAIRLRGLLFSSFDNFGKYFNGMLRRHEFSSCM